MLGVLGTPREDPPLLESVESVLEELYDDRWSAESVVPVIRFPLGVPGVRVFDAVSR